MPFSLPTWQKCHYHSLGKLPYAETPGNERLQGWEGERVCLITYFVFVYLLDAFLYFVTNQYIGYAVLTAINKYNIS